MKAWHFVGEKLRDGRPVPADGEMLRHEGELKMCDSGLHASKRILDALGYAPGETICRVEILGEVIEDKDKLVASERTILWRIEGGGVLRAFARRCALDVIDQWDTPDVVRRYLETGDESLRATAYKAARNAAKAAAWPAAWPAARYAARYAAKAAAGTAASDVARSAASDVARSAARDAARDAASAAAWDKYNGWLEDMVMVASDLLDDDKKLLGGAL